MLNKLQKFRKNKEEGFTLIELLVVILIIGILAAIAIPSFLSQRKSANDAALQSDLANAGTAMWSFMATEKKLGNDAVPATLPKSILPLSKGTVLANTGTFDAFCIIGTNEGSNHTANGKDTPMAWDSKHGGLLTDGPIPDGACDSGDLDPVEEPNDPEAGGGGGGVIDIGEYPAYDAEHCYPTTLVVGQQVSSTSSFPLAHAKNIEDSFLSASYTATYKGSVYETEKCFYDWELSIKLDDSTINGKTDGRIDLEFDNPNGNNMVVNQYDVLPVENGAFTFVMRNWNQGYAHPDYNGASYALPSPHKLKMNIATDVFDAPGDDSSNYDTNNASYDRDIVIRDKSSGEPYYGKAYLFDSGYVKLEFNDKGMNGSTEILRASVTNSDYESFGDYKGSLKVSNGIAGFQVENMRDMTGLSFHDLYIGFGDSNIEQPAPEPEEEQTEEPVDPVLNSDASSYNIDNAIISTNFYLDGESGNAYLFDNGYMKLVFDSADMNRNIEVGSARVQTRDPYKFTGNFSGAIGVHNGESGFMLNDHSGIEAGNIEMIQIF